MLLLITFVLIALVFSFLCSIAEAVILSVNAAHIELLEEQGRRAGPVLRRLKADVGKPLAAILTLNTIAHTVGAAGAGAQAAVVFGDAYLGVVSAVLTLLILVFSEIIPKTLGAHHWRVLAPATAYGLNVLVWVLYPFVKLSERITGGLSQGPTLNGFSPSEFAAMADISTREGQLGEQESRILKNLFRLREMQVKDVMTPRTVVFALPEATTVADFFERFDSTQFSRIPIYAEDQEQITGFVLRTDLLLARARGEGNRTLKDYRREMSATLDSVYLLHAFDEFLRLRAHIMLVVDEYGGLQGLVTLEDLLETLIGLEIIDESDKTEDMQQLARRLHRHRLESMGVTLEE